MFIMRHVFYEKDNDLRVNIPSIKIGKALSRPTSGISLSFRDFGKISNFQYLFKKILIYKIKVVRVDMVFKVSSHIPVRMSTVFIKSNQQIIDSLLSVYYLQGSVLPSHLLFIYVHIYLIFFPFY